MAEKRGVPFILQGWRTRELRFAEGTAQSRMSRWAPDRLVVDYTRTMLGALAVVPAPGRVVMVGLGGGSQAKFLHRHVVGLHLDVVEINPEVIALRRAFRIPDDDARFRVVQADAAEWLKGQTASVDLLLVDGYDTSGIPAALSTQRFYNDCRACLRPAGVAAFNLYDTAHAVHLQRLRVAFGPANVAVVEESRQSNRVAFAWAGALAAAGAPTSLSRAGQRELREALDTVRSRIGEGR
ncbi:transferase [Silanimonas algicola]